MLSAEVVTHTHTHTHMHCTDRDYKEREPGSAGFFLLKGFLLPTVTCRVHLMKCLYATVVVI